MTPSGPDSGADEQPEGTEGAIYPIRAVERVCDILDILHQDSEGVALAAVAKRAHLPKSSAYRYLLALEGRRYIERDAATGLFRLGVAFRPQRSRQLDLFIERARPGLEKLRDELNETVNIGVLDGGQVVHVAVVECAQMMRLAARVGERSPLHATALGKVIAAELPVDRVRAILSAEGMEALTSHTITSADAYLAEVEKVKAAGFGLDDSEAQDDGRCVAVPLHGLQVPAGLSVSAPVNRLPRDHVPQVVEQLRQGAIELLKGYQTLPS
jgi:IclR family acetate operon transcriptional repressor